MIRKFVLVSARSVFLFLVFTLDVELRADVVLKSFSGTLEVEKAGITQKVQSLNTRLTEPVDIESTADSRGKFFFNSVFVGLAPKTFVRFEKDPEIRMFWGLAFIDTNQQFTVKTPQGEVHTKGGSFYVTVDRIRTSLAVLKGQAELEDRSSKSAQTLQAGYTTWVGGLLSSGHRVMGFQEAVDMGFSMAVLKSLSPLGTGEIDNLYDELLPKQRAAVNQVSEDNKEHVDRDLRKVAAIEKQMLEDEQRRQHELEEIRREFRKRAFGD